MCRPRRFALPLALLTATAAPRAQFWQSRELAPPPGGSRAAVVLDAATDRIMWAYAEHMLLRIGNQWRPGTALQIPVMVSLGSAPDRGRTVALVSDGIGVAQTWEWDGVAWLRATPAVQAPWRDSSMAFHRGTGRIVLFGGLFGDFWSWDGGQWQSLTPALLPTPRSQHSIGTDSARDRVVLFGGRDANSVPLDDTWEFDGAQWRAVSTANRPPPRAGAVMAYDSVRRRMVLCSGWSGSWFRDTWLYDGTNWQSPAGSALPGSGFPFAAAFDPSAGNVQLFATAGDTIENWQWLGSSWQLVGSAPGMRGASYQNQIAYDPVRDRIIDWGNRRLDNLTREWDGLAWRVIPGAVGPAMLDTWEFANMATDFVRGEVILVRQGGPAETWRWNGTTWTNLVVAAPPGRMGAAMAWDAGRSRIVMFGGQQWNAAPPLQDTWEWNGSVWQQLAPPAQPPGRSDAAMAFDPPSNRLVLFGGSNGTTLLDDTWLFDGVTWTQAAPVHRPPQFLTPTMASSTGGFLLLNGAIGIGAAQETWTWLAGDWIQLDSMPLGVPAHLAAWPTHAADVLFTGSGTWVHTAVSAGVSPFGTGCAPGPVVPRLDVAPLPVLGCSDLAFAVDHAAANSLAVLVADTGRANVAVGGCTLLALPRATSALAANAAGACTFHVRIPNSTTLLGAVLVAQAVVFDTVPSLAFSNGVQLVAGN